MAMHIKYRINRKVGAKVGKTLQYCMFKISLFILISKFLLKENFNEVFNTLECPYSTDINRNSFN